MEETLTQKSIRHSKTASIAGLIAYEAITRLMGNFAVVERETMDAILAETRAVRGEVAAMEVTRNIGEFSQ